MRHRWAIFGVLIFVTAMVVFTAGVLFTACAPKEEGLKGLLLEFKLDGKWQEETTKEFFYFFSDRTIVMIGSETPLAEYYSKYKVISCGNSNYLKFEIASITQIYKLELSKDHKMFVITDFEGKKSVFKRIEKL